MESRMLRPACILATPGGEPESLRFYLGVTTVIQVDPMSTRMTTKTKDGTMVAAGPVGAGALAPSRAAADHGVT